MYLWASFGKVFSIPYACTVLVLLCEFKFGALEARFGQPQIVFGLSNALESTLVRRSSYCFVTLKMSTDAAVHLIITASMKVCDADLECVKNACMRIMII